MKLLNWLQRMMMGRYGVDPLSWGLCGGYFLCRLLWIFTRWTWLSFLELALLLFCIYRIFSRDIPRRQAENRAFLALCQKIRSRNIGAAWNALGSRIRSIPQRIRRAMTHRTFSCPSCGQKLRVPRGKGKIAISCPRCGTEFIKKT